MWENLNKNKQHNAYYSVIRVADGTEGMDALRGMFPDAEANELNLVLFSTSGVHGTYITIEEAEHELINPEYGSPEVTFLVVHPRLASVRYGVCNPTNQADIDYLKRLRDSSHRAIARIGFRTAN